jgi:hypothetical protein
MGKELVKITERNTSITPISKMQDIDAMQEILKIVTAIGAVMGVLQVYPEGSAEYNVQSLKITFSTEMIFANFKDLSPKEINKAFSLAMAHNLPGASFKDLQATDYGKILTAYREYKANESRMKPTENEYNNEDCEAKNTEAVKSLFKEFKLIRRRFKKIGHKIYEKYSYNEVQWSLSYSILSDSGCIKLPKKYVKELQDTALCMAYNRLMNPFSHIDNTVRKAIAEAYSQSLKELKSENYNPETLEVLTNIPELHTSLVKEAKGIFRALSIKFLIENN